MIDDNQRRENLKKLAPILNLASIEDLIKFVEETNEQSKRCSEILGMGMALLQLKMPKDAFDQMQLRIYGEVHDFE